MASTVFRVRACRPWLRAVAAGLQALAALNLVELAALAAMDIFQAQDPERVPLRFLVLRLFYGSALPALLFAALWRSSRLELATDRAVLSLGVEIPYASIAAIEPWRIPLPWPGFGVRLRSGRRFALGISQKAPQHLAEQLCAAAGLPPPSDPSFRDAEVRARTRKLHHFALKFLLVPAVVTFILFRLHQRIAFGGLTGEWQLYGLARWLHTLTGVAFFVFGHFALLAAALRALCELAVQPLLRTRFAAKTRWAAESAAAIAYYGGTAAVLWLRLG
jgi:apolipoprotein N-acyltransferase